ncbi:MAG: universal stress protein [Alphaproteobacteria bacterium]|nr:universal stress protein [Alphaproteobacteria bacterium]
MSIRTILVPLSDATAEAGILGTAFAVAETFNAHVDAFHLRADPTRSISDIVGETVTPALVGETIKAAEDRAQRVATRVRKVFDESTAKARIEIVNLPSAHEKPTASYGEETGLKEYWVETRGRVSDLIVVRRPRNSTDFGARTIAEYALMGTGRPVLLAPATAPSEIGSSVAIAWNGSVEASKAVASAMPFLMRARTVTAISVVEKGSEGHNLDGLVQYLRWHGIRAKPAVVRSRRGDTGKAVRGAASRAKADLLVMGAYTHSRIREMIFGGVTDHVLRASRIPVLLAH